MDYLIRFIHTHEAFRQAEINALATLFGLEFEWIFYSEKTPFATIRFKNISNTEADAKQLIERSILVSGIYELWGTGTTYADVHDDVRRRSQNIWPIYRHASFRFELDCFQGKRSASEQSGIIDSFSYTGFEGPIRMKDPDNQFVIFEEYKLHDPNLRMVHMGRLIAESGRRAVAKYNLKKRSYIATTSMDAELSLVTANLALAAPGKLVYDPFMGTGSFPLACAHFGAFVFGSDLDGRSIRGAKGRSVKGNFAQYGTTYQYLGAFVADLTNTPLRVENLLDAIVCDPPYGVREGLKVLGSSRHELQEEVLLKNGMPAHLAENYVPPKKPYSFLRMMDDILDFGANMLVVGGRLCMWMPVAEETVEEDATASKEYAIPTHPKLELVSECTQPFNKWSRRLLTYRKMSNEVIDKDHLFSYEKARLDAATNSHNTNGTTADDLNAFRKKYFQGFKPQAS